MALLVRGLGTRIWIPVYFLLANDSYTFFESLGNLLKTGPTRTNVMDMICMLVDT